jgi:O-acetyl-ADP-ribose deacetylase (regulator of RNase III)
MELGGPTSAEIIRRATAATLREADRLGAQSLARVAFGPGVGGFALSEAPAIEVPEVRRHLAVTPESSLQRIVFAVRGKEAAAAFHAALAA